MQFKSKRNKKGFTLLEIIIVIIIVGVLASLALPKFFSTVEFSKGSEALSTLSSIRNSMTRCALTKGNNLQNCTNFGVLDMTDPGLTIGAHFAYTMSAAATNQFYITAKRNNFDGGDGLSTIILQQNATSILKRGTSAFAGI